MPGLLLSMTSLRRKHVLFCSPIHFLLKHFDLSWRTGKYVQIVPMATALLQPHAYVRTRHSLYQPSAPLNLSLGSNHFRLAATETGTTKSVAWARNVHRPRITQSHHKCNKEVVGGLFAHSAV